MTELSEIVTPPVPAPEPTIDELKAKVAQLTTDLAVSEARRLDWELEFRSAQETIRSMDREIADNRRLAASNSFLANELASQVAIQRTFIGSLDRATAALVEKDVKKAAKIVKRARDGNPFETPLEVQAEAKRLLQESDGVFEPIGKGTVTNG